MLENSRKEKELQMQNCIEDPHPSKKENEVRERGEL
jgi:hypothetical protein